MMTVCARNIGRFAALGMALWALLYARAQVQTDVPQPPLEQQQLQKQRRQELRSMVRQQQPGPVLNTAVPAVPATPASAAVGNGPRLLSMEEKNELRRQLTRDLRVAQVSKP